MNFQFICDLVSLVTCSTHLSGWPTWTVHSVKTVPALLGVLTWLAMTASESFLAWRTRAPWRAFHSGQPTMAGATRGTGHADAHIALDATRTLAALDTLLTAQATLARLTELAILAIGSLDASRSAGAFLTCLAALPFGANLTSLATLAKRTIQSLDTLGSTLTHNTLATF